MLRISKTPAVKKTINGHAYKLKKWSVVTTSLEGLKLAKVIAPSFTMIADMWMGKSTEQRELESIHQEVQDIQFLLTGAMTQLCGALDDEHFMDLQHKLLANLQIIVDDEAVDIEDWVEHFDNAEFTQDMFEVMEWSIKENLWDFFMKQDMFVSKIGMLTKLLNPLKNQVESLTESKESNT